MDDIDKGNYQAELTLQAYIEQVRRRVAKTTRSTGFCFNCEEPVAAEHLFCSPECRTDYEKRGLIRTKLNKE